MFKPIYTRVFQYTPDQLSIMNSSFIFQDSREYLIIVAVGDDHSAVNDLSPQVSLFHLQHVEYTAAYGYIDTSIAYQTTNFIDL